MKSSKHFYQGSWALLDDLYELTMAQGYWKAGMRDTEAVFHMFFRHHPFQGGFTVAAGLEALIDFVQGYHLEEDDLAFLKTLKGHENTPLFDKDFLQYLSTLSLDVDIDAVAEGTVVFPNEPLVRVKGPLIASQLLESSLLTLINFPSLIATKASRVCLAAGGDEVIEFGLRRAQGMNGALTAARAAYVGGCHSTSNVLAGKLFGIPVKGTHAHSWVQAFPDEQQAFMAWAKTSPNNAVFLVDTYDTVEGVKKAVEAGRWLREHGHDLFAIRLDSGDLAYLSCVARDILDNAGFQNTVIMASNELDEFVISEMKRQGAKITVWGVGTNLVTGKGQSALDGVYKLSAVRDPGQPWQYKLKLSEQMIKVSNPGILAVRRYQHNGDNVADVIYDVATDVENGCVVVDPLDSTRRKTLRANLKSEDLLVPIFKGGKLVYDVPPLAESRARCTRQLSQFHQGVKRFLNPHAYVVGMEKSLYDFKIELIGRVRRYQ